MAHREARVGTLAAADEPAWLGRIRTFNAFHNLLALHPELGFWVVRWDGEAGLEWLDLTRDQGGIRPFHFEIYYGKESRRDAEYLRAMRRARRERRLALVKILGFHDLFYPLPADPEGRTFLYAGQFCLEPPDWPDLVRRWRSLSGRGPANADPDFVRFVKMALELPVLSAEALAGLEQFVAVYGAFITGTATEESTHGRVEQLHHDCFAKHWPNNDWVDQAVSAERFQLTPWFHERELTAWMREEMRIHRLPTTAMALMPVEPGQQPLSPLQQLVRRRHVQDACIEFVSRLPECGATRLQDYGVTLVTSAAPGKGVPQTRLELRDQAERLRAFVEQRFGLRAVVGIGTRVPPGAPLEHSHREAVLALHLCVQLEQPVLFYEDHFEHRERPPYASLHRAGQRSAEALVRAATDELYLATDEVVRLLLVYADERAEVVRSLLLSMLFELFGALRRRQPLRDDVVEQFAAELAAPLESARSLSLMISAYKDAVERLAVMASMAAEGTKAIRLEATLQYLRENSREVLRLPDVAKKAGFSVPSFSRIFKRATGTSFLAHVRSLRLDRAKVLLRSTRMSLADIADECGFQSEHRLIRAFKKEHGMTPGSYRAGDA